MNAIKKFIQGLISQAQDEVVGNAGNFGLGGFGDIAEIVSKISDATGLSIQEITPLASVIDSTLLGHLAQIAQQKIDFSSDAGKGMIQSIVTQISESEHATELRAIMVKLPVPEDVKRSFEI